LREFPLEWVYFTREKRSIEDKLEKRSSNAWWRRVKTMVKVITVIKRKEGMSREEFSRYWEKEHGPLIAKVFPGVQRYVQNHALKLPGRSGEPQFDGVVEMWFEDMAAWEKASEFFRGDEGQIIRDDEEKFINRSEMVFLVAEEKVIIE
jgi:uncharacterized protein (TIGR02118 family)